MAGKVQPIPRWVIMIAAAIILGLVAIGLLHGTGLAPMGHAM